MDTFLVYLAALRRRLERLRLRRLVVSATSTPVIVGHDEVVAAYRAEVPLAQRFARYVSLVGGEPTSQFPVVQFNASRRPRRADRAPVVPDRRPAPGCTTRIAPNANVKIIHVTDLCTSLHQLQKHILIRAANVGYVELGCHALVHDDVRHVHTKAGGRIDLRTREAIVPVDHWPDGLAVRVLSRIGRGVVAHERRLQQHGVGLHFRRHTHHVPHVVRRKEERIVVDDHNPAAIAHLIDEFLQQVIVWAALVIATSERVRESQLVMRKRYRNNRRAHSARRRRLFSPWRQVPTARIFRGYQVVHLTVILLQDALAHLAKGEVVPEHTAPRYYRHAIRRFVIVGEAVWRQRWRSRRISHRHVAKWCSCAGAGKAVGVGSELDLDTSQPGHGGRQQARIDVTGVGPQSLNPRARITPPTVLPQRDVVEARGGKRTA